MATISDLWAIDVHGHYGRYPSVDATGLTGQLLSGDPATVVARAKAARTAFTVVSPLPALLPRGGADAVAANEEAARVVEQTDGLLEWVVVHPLQPRSFDQARRMFGGPKCVGIKIHPEEHGYPIAEHGRAIFELAAELGAAVLTHSGDPNSKPGDFLPFADDFPEVTLILAHLGNGGAAAGPMDLQVTAIRAAKHANVVTDTSGARSLTSGLIEWAVREVGAERILYGTDTPMYFAPSQRARIDRADLTDREKRMILRDNAERLLPIPRDTQAKKEHGSC